MCASTSQAKLPVRADQREQAQQRDAEHEVRDDQRRQEQAVEEVAARELVAADGEPAGTASATRQRRRSEREPQAVPERLR